MRDCGDRHFGMEVDHLDAAKAELTRRGVALEGETDTEAVRLIFNRATDDVLRRGRCSSWITRGRERACERRWGPTPDTNELLQQEQEGPVTDLADSKRIVVVTTRRVRGNPEKAAADTSSQGTYSTTDSRRRS